LEGKKKRSIRRPSYATMRIGSGLFLIVNSVRVVFSSNWTYIALAGAVSSVFWVIFCVFNQLLFFSPVFVFYLPNDAVMGFILSTIISILLGIVVSMNLYILRHSKGWRIGTTSLFRLCPRSSFEHMCQLFIRWLPSSFYFWRSMDSSIRFSF
jgi:hypothetical protein